jgi:hypothetical protein
VLDDTDWSKQEAGTGQGIMMMLACCEEILKDKKGSLSARLECLLAVRRFRRISGVFVRQTSVLACCEEIPKEKRSLSARLQCLIAMRRF